MSTAYDKQTVLHSLVLSPEGRATRSVPLARESSVLISLNGRDIVDIQCSPDNLDEFAVGFLVAEGLLRERGELESVLVAEDGKRVEVRAQIEQEQLLALDHMKVTSGCGRGVTLDNVEEVMDCDRPFNLALMLPAGEVQRLGAEFNAIPGLHRLTHGAHSAALSDGVRQLCFAEDIGRHNAVDKVVGHAFLEGWNLATLVLLVSGRFSFEMVAKAVRVRIPLAISPSAATHQAAELAARFHLALCGMVRRTGIVVYSAAWRVT